MNDMGNLKSSRANIVNAFQLVIRVVGVYLCANMCKYAIAFALANIESLTIARIYEAIDVSFEFIDHFRWKRL